MAKMIHRQIISTKTKNYTEEVLCLSRGNQGSRKFKAGSYLPPPVLPEKFVLLWFPKKTKEKMIYKKILSELTLTFMIRMIKIEKCGIQKSFKTVSGVFVSVLLLAIAFFLLQFLIFPVFKDRACLLDDF